MPITTIHAPSTRSPWAGAVLAALVLATAASAKAAVADEASAPRESIATWRGGSVDRETYESWLRFRQPKEPPTTAEEIRTLVEGLLVTQVLAEEATISGTAELPAVRFAAASLERKTLVRALRRYRGDRVEVDPDTVAAQIAAQPELRSRPRKLRLRNLFKRLPSEEAGDEERAAVWTEMERLLAELRAGSDFAALASRESQSQTRFQGGLIGNVEPSKLSPAIAAAAKKLSPGELSEVIETAEGLTILRCDDVLPELHRSAEEVHEMVHSHFYRQREKEEWEALREQLLAEARPRLDLAAARGDESTAVVAEFAGGRLTRVELGELAAASPVGGDLAELDDARLRSLLEGWVFEVVAAERARELGLAESAELREGGVRWQQLQLLAGQELGQRVVARFRRPTAAEVRAHYDANRGSFRTPERYELQLIAITLDEGKGRERLRFAEELRRRLISGEIDFATAAREHSSHPSAEQGGVVGWVTRRQAAGFGPWPLRVLAALPEGTISELVQSERTLWIFRILDREGAATQPWEQASERAEQSLARERIDALQAEIESEIRRDLAVRLVEAD